jgi:hypothetical protein
VFHENLLVERVLDWIIEYFLDEGISLLQVSFKLLFDVFLFFFESFFLFWGMFGFLIVLKRSFGLLKRLLKS